MVTLRPARPDDARAVREVHVTAVRELGAAHCDEDQLAAWGRERPLDRYREHTADADGSCLVAVADGDVAGCGRFDPGGCEVTAV